MLMVQLDDDFRVEVEIVGHVIEVDARQGVQIICAVAAVELRQIQPQRAILENREDTVADIFIERHAALQRSAIRLHHARSENGVRFTRHDGMVNMRENFGRILAVAMQ